MRVRGDLSHGRREPAREVEDEVAEPAHRVLDLRTEGPQEDHVAENVGPAAVHEHRAQDRDPVTAGRDVGGDHRPAQREGLAPGQLEREDDRVRAHEQGREDRTAHGSPGRGTQGNDRHDGAPSRSRRMRFAVVVATRNPPRVRAQVVAGCAADTTLSRSDESRTAQVTSTTPLASANAEMRLRMAASVAGGFVSATTPAAKATMPNVSVHPQPMLMLRCMSATATAMAPVRNSSQVAQTTANAS